MLRAKVSVFVDMFVQSEALQRSLDSITALNAALRDSEASTRAVLDNVADGIVTAGETGLIESLNPSARALFGYREQEVIGRPLALLIAPRAAGRVSWLGGRAGLLQATQSRTTETLGCRQDGSTFAMEVEHGEIKLGDRTLTLAFVRDISERKAYTESLEHQALHDALTGLANRTLFGEHVLQALASAKRNDESRAVLVMDLDGFKQVNDTLGHDHGDVLLKQVGRAARGVRCEKPTRSPGSAETSSRSCPAARPTWRRRRRWRGRSQQTCKPAFVDQRRSRSRGGEHRHRPVPAHGNTTDELLRRADAAMYVAKKSGSGHAVFDAAQETQTAASTRAAGRPAPVRRPRGAGPSLSAQDRPGHARDLRRRSAGALAAPRPGSADRRAASCPRWSAPN